MPRREPPLERLMLYVDRSGGPDSCWPYMKARNRHGYGVMGTKHGNWMAHRLAYEVAYGPIPTGKYVLHTCDNPPCCNPRHLFVGDQQANMDDMWRKGRQQSYLSMAVGERIKQSKLTEAQVIEMRRRFDAGERPTSLGREFGVSSTQAWNICHRRWWKHIP